MKSYKDQVVEGGFSVEREQLAEAIKLIEDIATSARRYATMINKQGSAASLVWDGMFIGRLQAAADILRTELSNVSLFPKEESNKT